MAEGITDKRGEEALLAFLYPVTLADMTDAQRTEFAHAAEEQLGFLDSAEGRSNTSIRSESVGDVSVTYAVTAESQTSGGIRIAPAAYNRLMRCGLLTRWV